MSLFELFVNAVHVSEVEDGFVSNRRPMSEDQRKAMYASGGGGFGGGGKGSVKTKPRKAKGRDKLKHKVDPHAGFYSAPNINEVRKQFPYAFDGNGKMRPGYSFSQVSPGGRITAMSFGGERQSVGGGSSGNKPKQPPAALYKPPVDIKDMQPPWSPERDLGRRISEYEDRTGQRWPGPTTTDGMPPNYPGGGTAPPMPIDPGGAIGQDSQGNPIFRGPNGQPVVYDRKTDGLRPPGLQMPAIPARGPQLGGPGGPVKSVASIKGLSVDQAAARVNETKPGTIERLIAEQDLMVAKKIDENRKLWAGIEGSGMINPTPVQDSFPIRDDMRDRGYNPTPGFGTPPSQRGGIRTQEFRDSDGDRIDDRDQDGPGMPRYGTPGYNPTPGYGTPPSQRGGMRSQEFRDADGDRIDDRDQDGPGMPRYGRPGVGAPGLVTTPGFRVPDQFGPPFGYIPPNLREPTPYVPPHNRYSSSDPNWKQKMLAVQNKGSIAGRMAERRVQMTEPGWRVEMGGQMSGSYVPETLRRVR